jgi:hypothetical protein
LHSVQSELLHATICDIDLGDAATPDVSLLIGVLLVIDAIDLVVSSLLIFGSVEGIHVALVVDTISDEVLLVIEVEAGHDGTEDCDKDRLVVEQVLAHESALDRIEVRSLL